ncbi:galactose oxidase [Amylocystis lapponica]|nr:galactose oxidase [Amylocystis lapponica]
MPLPPESRIDSPRIGILSDVPEESILSAATPRSPYFHNTGSTSTFKAAASTSSLTSVSSSSRAPAGPRNPAAPSRSTTPRSTTPRSASDVSPSTPSATGEKSRAGTRNGSPATLKDRDRDRDRAKDRERDSPKDRERKDRERERHRERGRDKKAHKVRNVPHLPNAKEVVRAPATLMYWSRAPVFGVLPVHGVRAHSVTLVDSIAWLFGGCDEKGCWRDVFCFNTETMEWTHPDMLGEIPPPCRAHTATLVDRRIVVFGGGEGPVYYNELYILDTVTRRWSHPVFPEDTPIPPPRRAHTAVFYKNKVWIFGGGNGAEALNDVWTLDMSVPQDKLRWEQLETRGKKPTARGYHTANLVGNVMVIVGGSDGRECFSDIWCLNLDTLFWSIVKLDVAYQRLSHTATQVGSYLFLMGGHDGSQYTSELLLFNLVSLNFEPRATAGKPPSPRGYHVSFLTDSRLYVFGGFNGNEVYDDVHILELAGAAYLPQVTSFKIDVE